MVPVEPNKYIEQPASGFIFHPFPHLPWELRRLVWEFALPRNVFLLPYLSPETCVHCPTISQVCREASLVMKESGSMITGWDSRSKILSPVSRYSRVTDHLNIYRKTWFSPKLDTIMLDPEDLRILRLEREAAQCDLIKICKSPRISLMLGIHDFEHSSSSTKHQIYERYLKSRETVLLRIAGHDLLLKDEAWGKLTAPQKLTGTRNATDLIRLDDTAAVVKYLKLWTHCCQEQTTDFFTTTHCDFGSWMEMVIDEEKRPQNDGYMRTYNAWMVEDEAYVRHRVTPEAWFLLGLADSIMFNHGILPGAGRGHEIMDFTGKLKEGHPLIRELDIKLPEVIPVCTIRMLGPCICKNCHAQKMSETDSEK